jgi:hypothetical protein
VNMPRYHETKARLGLKWNSTHNLFYVPQL